MLKYSADKDLRFNLAVNIIDGGFFGFALGFASFSTVIPLFVANLTDSALLIGLIPAIHNMGWQLPQLLTAEKVARQARLKPMVLFLTVHERLPFLALAGVAWLAPFNPGLALALTFIMLVWQGLGGGVTANAWQSMIAKIIPSELRGTFLGMQSAAANLLASLSAVAAGVILEKLSSPLDFSTCFLAASACMVASWGALALTRERASPIPAEASPALSPPQRAKRLGAQIITVLRSDVNFRWFLTARMTTQVAATAFAFYIVYAVQRYNLSESTAGVMTSVLMITQIVANPLLGWVGDRFNHRKVMASGALLAALGALLAWAAPGPGWFYLVFILTGIANVTIWTVAMTITLYFGKENERPTYIGMANTLIAPATILAPVIGGWLADRAGYPAVFLMSIVGGLVTAAVLLFKLQDPNPREAEHAE